MQAPTVRGRVRRDRATWPAYVASVAALGYAALKAYWGAGGTALLDTVSLTSNEKFIGNPWFVAFGLWGTAVLAVLGAAIALATIRPWGQVIPRWILLVPAWFGCALLIPRGALGLVGDVIRLTGTTRPALEAGVTAVDVQWWTYWDVFFYSPLFLIWGFALAATAWSYGRRAHGTG